MDGKKPTPKQARKCIKNSTKLAVDQCSHRKLPNFGHQIPPEFPAYPLSEKRSPRIPHQKDLHSDIPNDENLQASNDYKDNPIL